MSRIELPQMPALRRLCEYCRQQASIALGYQPDELCYLGMGRTSIAFSFHDTSDGTMKAIKISAQHMCWDQQRLENEHKICSRNYPNVVKAFQCHTKEFPWYATFELLDGPSFEQIGSTIPGKEQIAHIVRLTSDICDGLSALHQDRWIHSDIKPDAIVEHDGHAKLLDFSHAREFCAGNSHHDESDERYRAPELWLEHPIDGRVDLYGLGVTLYEVLTSKHPFSLCSLQSSHLKTVPRPPKVLNPNIPDALSEVVLNLMEKDPDRRMASAAILKVVLKSIIQKENYPHALTA